MKNILYLGFFAFSLIFTNFQLQAQTENEIRQFFVDKINKFRASLNLPELQRWEEGEACADQSALEDATSNTPYKVGRCKEAAHFTCPMYKTMNLIQSYCVESVENAGSPPLICTGPYYRKHEAYLNLTSPTYTKVAVGIYKISNGRYLVSMNFQ